MKPQINLAEHGVQLKCEKCDNKTFNQTFYIFKVSKLLTGDSQDTIAPVPLFECSQCGHVNSEFKIGEDEPPETKEKIFEL